MTSLVEVPFDDGGYVVIEMDDVTGRVVKAGRTADVAGRAAQTLESALEAVAPTARAVLAKVRAAHPQQITVEFGIKLSAEAGAVITRTSGECNFKVTLQWEQRNGDPD